MPNDFSGFLPQDYKDFLTNDRFFDFSNIIKKSELFNSHAPYSYVEALVIRWWRGKKTRKRVELMHDVLEAHPTWHWTTGERNKIFFYEKNRFHHLLCINTKNEIIDLQ